MAVNALHVERNSGGEAETDTLNLQLARERGVIRGDLNGTPHK